LVYLLVVVAAVVLIAVIAYGTQRKSRDGVASFKRQIDALSPEARKPVVDQVQSVSDLRRSSDTPPDSDGSDDKQAADPADELGESADGS
jgi:hypothetical protein